METIDKENRALIGALDRTAKTNDKGKETGSVEYRGSLITPDDGKVKMCLDGAKVPLAGQQLILSWRNPSFKLNEKAVPAWFLNPVDDAEIGGRSQILALTMPTFEPKAFKKQFADIDLEHRKVTPDEDDAVATYVQVTKDNEPVMRYDTKLKKEVEVWNWTKAGRKLFTSNELKSFYNFVRRLTAMQDLEPAFNEVRDKFIADGGTTIELKHNDQKLTQVVVKDRKVTIGKKVEIGDSDYSLEDIAQLAAQGKILIEQGS